MAVYWVTFRLAETGNYERRYESLREQLAALSGGKWWVEPSSFVLFRSDASIDDVAAAVARAIDESIDIALISMTEFQDARVVGRLEDGDLFTFMPFAKKA